MGIDAEIKVSNAKGNFCINLRGTLGIFTQIKPVNNYMRKLLILSVLAIIFSAMDLLKSIRYSEQEKERVKEIIFE